MKKGRGGKGKRDGRAKEGGKRQMVNRRRRKRREENKKRREGGREEMTELLKALLVEGEKGRRRKQNCENVKR